MILCGFALFIPAAMAVLSRYNNAQAQAVLRRQRDGLKIILSMNKILHQAG